jgi:MarR family transcriptional repressor of emrRAB
MTPAARADWAVGDRPGPPDPGALSHLANVLGGLAVGITDMQADTLRAATGLDLSAAAALTTLLDRPGLSIEALRRVLGLTHSGAARLADRLATRGLLERSPGADRRTATLRLTDSGAELAGAALGARRDALRPLLAPLNEGQRIQLSSLVAAIASVLVSERGQARRVCRHCDHACCRGTACPIGRAADDT